MVYKVYATLVMKGMSFSFYKYDGKDVFDVNDVQITVDENEVIEMNGCVSSLKDVEAM